MWIIAIYMLAIGEAVEEEGEGVDARGRLLGVLVFRYYTALYIYSTSMAAFAGGCRGSGILGRIL